jgi:2-alkenal reductase
MSFPHNREGTPARSAPSPAKGPGARLVGVLALLVLALGMLLGYALGWVSFGLPWGSPDQRATLYDEQQVVEVFDRASPAVVEITVARSTGNLPLFQTSGSGFLVDDDGHIVTNHHVVAGSDRITVEFHDGRELDATPLGSSPADDLAVLRVDPDQVRDIDPLDLADSDELRPGQLAIAIGSPFRKQNSISVGVVSGVGRSETRPRDRGRVSGSILQRPVADLVQTTAALNPGSSGGPLLDRNGAVIGVNSAVRIESGVQVGIGFAVPSNTVAELLPEMKAGSLVRRPWLGIRGSALNDASAEEMGLAVESGVYITEVLPDSPAAQAKLKGDSRPSFTRPAGDGDVILALDEEAVSSVTDIVSLLNTRRPGDRIALTVLRDNVPIRVTVILDDWPDT